MFVEIELLEARSQFTYRGFLVAGHTRHALSYKTCRLRVSIGHVPKQRSTLARQMQGEIDQRVAQRCIYAGQPPVGTKCSVENDDLHVRLHICAWAHRIHLRYEPLRP
jgi:hypothetical protein